MPDGYPWTFGAQIPSQALTKPRSLGTQGFHVGPTLMPNWSSTKLEICGVCEVSVRVWSNSPLLLSAPPTAALGEERLYGVVTHATRPRPEM
uniref:Uncharacterized protein n=1 Tax=Coccidioides posadasii RMSCC 3488 TaxID=454284 RepID=A0A0J6F4P3_COCPO|nr:hypothetical protein CPAG_04224 [Coccidioides posadasii RMSCC 3488]